MMAAQAAFVAFMLILRNIVRVAAVNSVGSLVIFMGKVAVIAGTVLLALLVVGVRHVSPRGMH